VIIADSSNEHDLVEMAKQTRLIINVVGPYRLYGEAVVKAAVENGTSHVDISGEPAVSHYFAHVLTYVSFSGWRRCN
jgi:short subunit dehydrogenase-like uncharacterized protein